MPSETFHEDFTRHEEVSAPSDRRFGLIAAGIFTVLAGVPLARGGHPRVWALVVAAVFALTAIASPMLLGPVHRLLQRFGRLVHAIVSPMALAVIFFVGITPFGVLMRLFGHDPLRRCFEPHRDSYWIKRPLAGPAPDTMRNQF
jgi:hypothetical protein